MNKNCEHTVTNKVLNKSYEQTLWTRAVNKSCEQELWTKIVNRSYKKKFEQKLWQKLSCEGELWTNLLTRVKLWIWVVSKMVNKSRVLNMKCEHAFWKKNCEQNLRTNDVKMKFVNKSCGQKLGTSLGTKALKKCAKIVNQRCEQKVLN